ncbi:BPSS1780 family membrane protein [Paraburkholderia sp. DHOC27]|uniref:BPSS1780 family membrane protein n=1 Tax=Paraburkholderia sp. DHOC27 TaxID=2303330 RepID=UPI000E3C7CA7|nr:BPSS1780 family membrane protein [Paraburkholderia sp. DHOC27]RFU47732.1 hypothetical protein D0B32_09285 [Paraburkholderia sp. DHOC27]
MNTEYLRDVSKGSRLHQVPVLPFAGGREVNPLHIVEWLASGCRALAQQPVLWLSVLLISADCATLFGMLPLLRPLAVLLAPVVVGALMVAQDAASKGETVSLRELLATLGRRSNALCVIGLYGAAIVAIGYVVLLATFHVSLQSSVTASGQHFVSIVYGGEQGVRGVLESLLGASIFAVAIASACFAPALVMLHDMTPHDAMLESLSGAARNWPATLVYFVIVTVAVLLAPMVPLALRALVLTPVLTAVPLLSLYGAYRDVFIGR